MTQYPTFARAIRSLQHQFGQFAEPIHTERWQSIDISKQPAAKMYELINVAFVVPLDSRDYRDYVASIEPNLPWADRHFELERASGHPINPGWTWKEWPWGLSADKFRREGEQYSHSYAERYWPKHAGRFNAEGGVIPAAVDDAGLPPPNRGVRYNYGDLQDVINLLRREPLTRQAYLPVWFPEDTGVVHGERVPCTIGYHWMMRNNKLHVFYPIRSCDFVRHFRDDLYLTIRLTLWILEQLERLDDRWASVMPGNFSFWAGSLHMFVNDYIKLFGKERQ